MRPGKLTSIFSINSVGMVQDPGLMPKEEVSMFFGCTEIQVTAIAREEV